MIEWENVSRAEMMFVGIILVGVVSVLGAAGLRWMM
jgi:hypothetical protein